MLLVHVYQRPQKCTRLHLKHVTGSIPALLLTVVTVRKPNCLEKTPPELLPQYPRVRQHVQQRVPAKTLVMPRFLQSQVKKAICSAALFLGIRVKYG